MDDTAKLITVVLLASFAIERVIAAIAYLLDARRLYVLDHPAASTLRRKHRRKLALVATAGALAATVVYAADLRVLRTLSLGDPIEFDAALTWLVLFAGADRIRDLMANAGAKKVAKPPELPAFRVVVDDGAAIRELHRAS